MKDITSIAFTLYGFLMQIKRCLVFFYLIHKESFNEDFF